MAPIAAKFHERIPCCECLYKSIGIQEYEQHLALAHQHSKRKVKAAVTRSLRRHSMCRDCWKTHHGTLSSVGHEVPQMFRTWGDVVSAESVTRTESTSTPVPTGTTCFASSKLEHEDHRARFASCQITGDKAMLRQYRASTSLL